MALVGAPASSFFPIQLFTNLQMDTCLTGSHPPALVDQSGDRWAGWSMRVQPSWKRWRLDAGPEVDAHDGRRRR